MAKSGELTPEVIQGYEKLHKELVDSNLILEDGQTVAQAFCDEIYAIAESKAEKIREEIMAAAKAKVELLKKIRGIQ